MGSPIALPPASAAEDAVAVPPVSISSSEQTQEPMREELDAVQQQYASMLVCRGNRGQRTQSALA